MRRVRIPLVAIATMLAIAASAGAAAAQNDAASKAFKRGIDEATRKPNARNSEALYNLGRWADALNEFDESITQSQVQRTDYNAKLQGYYEGCRRQGYLGTTDMANANAQFDAAKMKAAEAQGREGGSHDR